ncbi:MAG: sulfotransferase family 2 domain-containing protein [Pseudomonadota bacterium]
MPICYKTKVIFIHIPRCGGTSIESHLGILGHNPLYGAMLHDRKVISLQHLTLKEVALYRLVTQITLQSFFKFTVIRDPVSRLFSDYHWQKNNDIHNQYGDCSFGEFLDIAERVINKGNYHDKPHLDHFRPMADYCRPHGDISLDRIVTLEKLTEQKEQLKPEVNLDNVEQKNRTTYPPNARPEQCDAERVREIYHEDVELYSRHN